jgi:hypothetical protein
MENLFAGIFGILLGLVGVLTALRGLKNRTRLQHWKTTKGRVIERGTYQPDQPMLSASAFRYSPLIRYSYQVDGKDFVSNAIIPRRIQLPQHNTKKWAEKQAATFPDDVTVFYNPSDPAESYLKQASRTALLVVIAMSVLAFLAGTLFLLARFM